MHAYSSGLEKCPINLVPTLASQRQLCPYNRRNDRNTPPIRRPLNQLVRLVHHRPDQHQRDPQGSVPPSIITHHDVRNPEHPAHHDLGIRGHHPKKQTTKRCPAQTRIHRAHRRMGRSRPPTRRFVHRARHRRRRLTNAQNLHSISTTQSNDSIHDCALA